MVDKGDGCFDPTLSENEQKLKIESISNNGLVLAFRSGCFVRIFNLKDRIENNKPQKECLTDYHLNLDLEKICKEDASLEEYIGKDKKFILEDIDVSIKINDN